MSTAQLVVLNGASSSGKTTLCKKLKQVLDEPYIHLEEDCFVFNTLDASFLEGDGAPEIFRKTMLGYYRSLKAFLSAGHYVLADTGFYSTELVAMLVEELRDERIWLVGVYCDLAELERRELARADRPAGLAREQFASIHAGTQYDVTVDTTATSVDECVLAIKAVVTRNASPSALTRMEVPLKFRSMFPQSSHTNQSPREGFIRVEHSELYYREIGTGRPLLILHGGPDFDQTYFLPELDLLADSYRLIYYDQRGRGKSAANVSPEDVTIESEIRDLDQVREFFHLESLAVLGHSWGGLLAMEYAIRHPRRVSHLILMDTAPASYQDYMWFREYRRAKWPEDIAILKALYAESKYQEGNPQAVADYYRVHFRATVKPTERLDYLMERFRRSFVQEGILKARAIEDRLMDETWRSSDYNLLPRLNALDTPTLVLHGDYDFIPVACSEHVADAIPGARLVSLRDCGHFSFMDCPEQVHREIDAFFLASQN